MINQEGYVILKGLDDKYKWVARDSGGDLWAYKERPFKGTFYWVPIGSYSGKLPSGSKRLFQFIQWEDEEPHSIAELIEEYEDSKEYKDILVIEYFLDKEKRREEIEVKKDKEWAKSIVRKELKAWQNIEGGIDEDGIKYILDIINQLDEPEKVVVPEFVADWMEENSTGRCAWWKKIAEWEGEVPAKDRKVYDWYAQYNEDTFIIAWITNRYEIEKEPLFYVPTGLNKRGLYESYLAKEYLGSIDVDWADETYFKSDKNAERYRFTEQEIRSMPKGDIYFKYFAVPAEVQDDTEV